MNGVGRGERRDRIWRAAVMSAVVGPLATQMTAGLLARLQSFFCPLNFLPIYAVSFIVLAPGFFLIGLAGADIAARRLERGRNRWLTFWVLAAAGALLGALYFTTLAQILRWVFYDYAPLLALPGLGASVSLGGALSATWSLVFRRTERQAFSLRETSSEEAWDR